MTDVLVYGERQSVQAVAHPIIIIRSFVCMERGVVRCIVSLRDVVSHVSSADQAPVRPGVLYLKLPGHDVSTLPPHTQEAPHLCGLSSEF